MAGLKPLSSKRKRDRAQQWTQAMTASRLALHDAEVLADASDVAAALTLEAVKGKSIPFSPLVQAVRPHAGTAVVAAHVRAMCGKQTGRQRGRDTSDKVQIRILSVASAVHGASRIPCPRRSVLETEINSATDNPLIFPRETSRIQRGNFHGQPVALVMDFSARRCRAGRYLRTQIGKAQRQASQQRMPPFCGEGGLESGLMIAPVHRAASVS